MSETSAAPGGKRISSALLPGDLWRSLIPRLTPERVAKLERAAALRTNHFRLVVQDIHHPHNVSACMRSAEAFGVLGVDVVNIKEKFSPSTVARGVASWIQIRKFKSPETCIDNLKHNGYLIATGVPYDAAYTLPQIPVDRPVAVVFGNEHDGVDRCWLEKADLSFTIPMDGLVESLNISVSAAITLFTLTQKAKSQLIAPGAYYLRDQERLSLLDEWAEHHLPR